QWGIQRRRHPRVAGVGLDGFVGQQVGLGDQLDPRVERLDLVADRGHGPLGERHESFGADPNTTAGGGGPFGLPSERPGTEVEDPEVVRGVAVTHVERFVLDEQADDLAVGHVDDGLAGLRIAVGAFGVRQFVLFVETVEVGAGHAPRFALLQRSPHTDVAVGKRERRLGALELIEVQALPAKLPGGTHITPSHSGRTTDHVRSSNRSARSSTTMSAPCSRSAFSWAACSAASALLTPTTNPKPPSRPARTPAWASSNTAAADGRTPNSAAHTRKESGAGLPRSPLCLMTTPSTRACT